MAHATGFGAGSVYPSGSDLLHFLPAHQPTGICNGDATVQTMCNGYDLPGAIDGRQITLEEHDVNTFQAGY
jgi:hypothetical protein